MYVHVFFTTELAAEFIKPLGEYRVVEKQAVTLECEVSKPDRSATWYKAGELLQASDRLEMRVEGTKHYLTIKDSVLDDEDKYSIKVEENESHGKLFVDGQFYFFCLTLLCDHKMKNVNIMLSQTFAYSFKFSTLSMRLQRP